MGSQDFIAALPAQLNIPLIICLFAGGYIIKNTPALRKINNSLIPLILPLISIIICVMKCNGDFSQGIMSGIINSAFAVWMHQTGKNIFYMLPSGVSKDELKDEEDEEEEPYYTPEEKSDEENVE